MFEWFNNLSTSYKAATIGGVMLINGAIGRLGAKATDATLAAANGAIDGLREWLNKEDEAKSDKKEDKKAEDKDKSEKEDKKAENKKEDKKDENKKEDTDPE